MAASRKKKLTIDPKTPEEALASLGEWCRREALLHSEADIATGKGGWVCQCGACRGVRDALYGGAGNAEKP